jgi:hypothetical protein
VSEAENEALMLTFTDKELDLILASMKVDTAPGPNGLSMVFFKNFWDLIKSYIRAIANGFALGRVDVERLNFGILTLIPKVQGAKDIQHFRPISLINVIFKFVAKAFALRLTPIAHQTISRTQYAFIKGIHIHEGFSLCKRLYMLPSPRNFRECS